MSKSRLVHLFTDDCNFALHYLALTVLVKEAPFNELVVPWKIGQFEAPLALLFMGHTDVPGLAGGAGVNAWMIRSHEHTLPGAAI